MKVRRYVERLEVESKKEILPQTIIQKILSFHFLMYETYFIF